MRRSGLPRSRLRGSGHRRGSPFRTSRSSSITSALILLRQRANVSPVAPAARSSFHRARIAAISSTSGRSIFVFVMTSSIGGRPLKTRCQFGGNRCDGVRHQFRLGSRRTLVFFLWETTVRAGNRPTPLMINNSESQDYHDGRFGSYCRPRLAILPFLPAS